MKKFIRALDRFTDKPIFKDIMISAIGMVLLLALLLTGCGMNHRCLSGCLNAAIEEHSVRIQKLGTRPDLTAEDKASLLPSEAVILRMEKTLCEVKCR